MKKLTYSLSAVLLASAMFASCIKTPEVTPATPQPTTPTGPAAPTVNVEGVNAAFVGVTMTFTYDLAGTPVDLSTEAAVAAVYSSPWSAGGTNTMVDAGTIAVNNINLDKATNNSYSKTATAGQTPSDLGFSSGMQWTVSGGNGFPAITRNVTSSKPDYTGTVPSTVSRTSAFTMTFNASTTQFSDSVYVVLITGSTSIVKAYKSNAGTITIPASEMAALSATSTTNPGYIEICPWNVQYYTEMGKTYACVRERAIVKSITVN